MGTFQTNDNLLSTSSDESDGQIKTSANGALTLAGGANQRTFDEVKQVFMNDGSGASDEDFTADLVLNVNKTLSGTYRTETSGTDNLIGVAGYDTSEVRIGDVLEIPSGAGATEERVAIASDAIFSSCSDN